MKPFPWTGADQEHERSEERAAKRAGAGGEGAKAKSQVASRHVTGRVRVPARRGGRGRPPSRRGRGRILQGEELGDGWLAILGTRKVQFRWKAMAEKTWAVYRKVADKK
jgi:hypothetical protein